MHTAYFSLSFLLSSLLASAIFNESGLRGMRVDRQITALTLDETVSCFLVASSLSRHQRLQHRMQIVIYLGSSLPSREQHHRSPPRWYSRLEGWETCQLAQSHQMAPHSPDHPHNSRAWSLFPLGSCLREIFPHFPLPPVILLTHSIIWSIHILKWGCG